MRDIKFRARMLTTSSWIEGFITHITKDYRVNEDNGNVEDLDINAWYMLDDTGCTIPIEPETIGQYAGLKDKNGKEIYEGDILKVSYNKKECSKSIVSVFYSNEFTRYELSNYESLCDYEDLEVIGNIYDNPELIKE